MTRAGQGSRAALMPHTAKGSCWSVARRVWRAMPGWARTGVRAAADLAASVPYRGRGLWCPVCERASRRFVSYGVEPWADARCVHCRSLARHRLVWLYFLEMTDLMDGAQKRVLHVAPEPCLEGRLRQRLGSGYVTADFQAGRADMQMDVTAIDYPDEHFDVIYCSHVLEHVQDDRRAMREFRRVLKPDGWAVLLVPVNAEKTREDPSVVDPAERLRLFGQKDHVRMYGPDYGDRLREAGFVVTVLRVPDFRPPREAGSMGLTAQSGEIYRCVPNNPPSPPV